MREVNIKLAEVRDLTMGVLRLNGLNELQSSTVADVVARAEADECKSHGLYRVPGYVAALRSGRVNRDAVPQLSRPIPGIIKVNGEKGFAPAAVGAGRDNLIAAARENGIAAMAIGNCHHFSALWADIEPLVEAGLVCWTFVIGQLSVAPHGGTKRLMGTNPIGFGWPRQGDHPFIFDFATSAVARGEVELLKKAGGSLKPGWGIDREGEPTLDPEAALVGAMLPFGGYKGSALSMMVELIAGPLIGEMTSKSVANLGISDSGPPPGGELIVAIDPSKLSTDGMIARGSDEFFANARTQPGLRLSSDRRYAARARTATEGVQVDEALLQNIEALRR